MNWKTFFICGLTGWCMEILFTSLGGLLRGDLLLNGHTSIWMFPIYGLAAVIGPLSVRLRHWPVLLRGCFYGAGIMLVEFISGSFLRLFSLCPWDYSKTPYNISGLVRLDYFPYGTDPDITGNRGGVKMLNISGIHEGFVLDHIQAGMSLQIYHDLKLDKLDCSVAIIKNAKSNKMGKKDIIKVECPIEALDLDILGFIDHNITVNVIKGDRIVEKKELKLPKQVKNVIKCKNPRCVTSIEQELDQIFILADEEKEVYRCKYCEEKYTNPNRRQIKVMSGSVPYGRIHHSVPV